MNKEQIELIDELMRNNVFLYGRNEHLDNNKLKQIAARNEYIKQKLQNNE